MIACIGPKRQPATKIGRYAIVTEIGGIWIYPKKVNDIKSSVGLFEINSTVAEKVENIFDEINNYITILDGHNQKLDIGLQKFVEAKNNITTAFEAIEDNTSSCLSYSEQALHITIEQTTSIVHLKEFAQELDSLSKNLNKKLEEFKI